MHIFQIIDMYRSRLQPPQATRSGRQIKRTKGRREEEKTAEKTIGRKEEGSKERGRQERETQGEGDLKNGK